jgi:hypothetical protein
MIKLFRNIRKNLLNEGKTSRYFKYAIGEIVLVVIGILIALQINNWNENKKSIKDQKYVLTEVLKNLEEDAILVDEIIIQRQKAKRAITALQDFLNSETNNSDSLQFQLVKLLTFERYFPINNAYEILKSKGLQLSNNGLTTKISRYYDYEQPKMSNSILDIEVTILKIFNDRNGLVRFLSLIEKDERMVVKNPDDPIFRDELSFFLIAFQDNNGGTLEKLVLFKEINQSLREDIISELKKLT